MTRPWAEVIGDPIAHSKSPLIHNFWLGSLGIEGDYRATHVLPEGLADHFRSRRSDSSWRGCNVTIPHKEAIAPLVDRIDPRAQAVGAVNTVWRDTDGNLCATNTDVDGVAEAIAGADLSAGSVVVIGAGGAARAAFTHLSSLQSAKVIVLARNPAKAQAVADDCGLAAQVLQLEPGSGAFDGACLLINATQLGMTGQTAMPRFVLDELELMHGNALVFDMVYAPLETGLLKAAGDHKRQTSDGLTMLIGQAATAFERFFGQSPPREHDAELRRILTA